MWTAVQWLAYVPSPTPSPVHRGVSDDALARILRLAALCILVVSVYAIARNIGRKDP